MDEGIIAAAGDLGGGGDGLRTGRCLEDDDAISRSSSSSDRDSSCRDSGSRDNPQRRYQRQGQGLRLLLPDSCSPQETASGDRGGDGERCLPRLSQVSSDAQCETQLLLQQYINAVPWKV